MNLVNIGNLTINLDNIAYWTVRPKTPGSTSHPQPPDEPIVTIHFIGNVEPVSLHPPTAALFLSFAEANLGIKSLQA
jgi:hypothetical protein